MNYNFLDEVCHMTATHSKEEDLGKRTVEGFLFCSIANHAQNKVALAD